MEGPTCMHQKLQDDTRQTLPSSVTSSFSILKRVTGREAHMGPIKSHVATAHISETPS